MLTKVLFDYFQREFQFKKPKKGEVRLIVIK